MYNINNIEGPHRDKNLYQSKILDNNNLIMLHSLKESDAKQFTYKVLTQIGDNWVSNIWELNSQTDFTKNRLFPHKVIMPDGRISYSHNPPIPQFDYVYIDIDLRPDNYTFDEDGWKKRIAQLTMQECHLRYPVTLTTLVDVEDMGDSQYPEGRDQEQTLTTIRMVPVQWIPYEGKLGSVTVAKEIIEKWSPPVVQGKMPAILETPDTGVHRENLFSGYATNIKGYLQTIFGSSNLKDEIGRYPTENDLDTFIKEILAVYNEYHKYFWNILLPYKKEYKRCEKLESMGAVDFEYPKEPDPLVLPPNLARVDKLMKEMGLQYKFPAVNMVCNYSPEMKIAHAEVRAKMDGHVKEDPDERTVPVSVPVDNDNNRIYPREGGEVFLNNVPLINMLQKFNTKCIISPFGTYYRTSQDKCSFLKGLIDGNMKQRKAEKKLMLEAKKAGDKVKAKYHNNAQTTIKYRMNSMPGSMGSKFNFLSNRPNFNSVTSIARFFIMNAYAHAERFLEGNFFFRTEEQLMNHLVNCRVSGPKGADVEKVVTELGLKIPAWQEVFVFLVGQLRKYDMAPNLQYDYENIKIFLCRLSMGELCFLYYMSNMKHLIQHNEEIFRPWLQDFFSCDNIDLTKDCDPADIRNLDGDLAIVISTVYASWFPTNDEGNSISIYDCIEKAPDVAKKLVLIGRHMVAKLEQISKAFQIFFNHQVCICYVAEHKQMKRDAIILSDTDSIIFTTKSWVEWYNGKLVIDQTAFNINALIVYWLTKANAFILYNVSKAFGATNKDLYTMAMKNEFMMPVEILTTLKKHYASILKVQEGVVYAKPVLDIKGVGLRGSNYCKETLNYAENFIASCIDSIYTQGKVSIQDKLIETLRLERYIYDSLLRGEPKFLQVEPVKSKDEYKNADIGIYFNYMFWEEIFAEKYGNIIVPTKCYILPLTNVRSMTYRNRLSDRYKDIYEKLMAFLENNPGKDITRVPLNPLIDSIPEELRPVIHYKNVIYSNVRPMYIILQSLGHNFGNNKYTFLASDAFGWVTEEESKKVEPWFVSVR